MSVSTYILRFLIIILFTQCIPETMRNKSAFKCRAIGTWNNDQFEVDIVKNKTPLKSDVFEIFTTRLLK